MGNCMGVKCKCRNKSLSLGSGWNYSDVYRKASEDIKNGLYGEEMKQLINETGLVSIDANYRAYLCEDCGYIDALVCCDLYRPNCAVHSHNNSCSLLKECEHFCPICKKKLTKLDERDIKRMKCPKCGEKYSNYTFSLENGEELEELVGLWD